MTPNRDEIERPLGLIAKDVRAIANEMIDELRPVTGACRMLDALVVRLRAIADRIEQEAHP